MRRTACVVGLCLAASVAFAQQGTGPGRIPSNAELVGDVNAGRVLAENVCGECHEVRPAATSAAGATPPAFSSIAQTPGMTEMALTVWLTTFHPARTMPPITLTTEERRNVTAYILWLGEQ